MQSKQTSVKGYLDEMPDDRRAAISAVREVIRKNLDPKLEEGMQYGMIGYYVPHRVFPAGYHCDPRQPLPYAALASQKGYMSLYLMGIYGDPAEKAWLAEQFRRAGKELDMGKSCIRFKRIEDLPLGAIGEAFRRLSVDKYVARYLATLADRGRGTAKKPAKAVAKPAAKAAKKPAAKAVAKPAAKAAAKAAKEPAAKAARSTGKAAPRSRAT